MTYAQKLLDKRWQQKKTEIQLRDNWECRCCHDTKRTVHVHHACYARNVDPWDYPDRVYYLLCDKCHDFMHEITESLNFHIFTSIEPWMFRLALLNGQDAMTDDLCKRLVDAMSWTILERQFPNTAQAVRGVTNEA